MQKQVTKNITKIQDSIEFEQVIERGCGIDIHRDTVVVTIQGKGIETATKTYATFHLACKNSKHG